MTHLIGASPTGRSSSSLGFFQRAIQPVARRMAEMIVGRDPDASAALQIDRARRALSGHTVDLEHPLGRVVALVERMEFVSDQAAEDALVARLARAEAPLRIGFLNAHAVNLAWHDPAVAEDFLELDIILRDGIGLERLLRRLARDPGRNMNGTDLIPKILEAVRGCPLAVYGTDDPWLGTAVQGLAKQGHVVADAQHGFSDDGVYATRFARSGAQIALLAMGMPKQERVSQALTREGGARLVLCGGAIVDFMAGRQARAPKWMRRHGLEWVFRLVQEPRRLCRRYLVGNAAFCMRTAFVPGRTPARLAASFFDWAQRDHTVVFEPAVPISLKPKV